MTFVLLNKKLGYNRINDNEVRINSGSFCIAKKLVSNVTIGNYVEVYLDREQKRVGFRFTDNRLTGFKVNKTKPSEIYYSVSSKTIVSMIPAGRYIGEVIDNMIVINVKEIATKN